MSALIIIKSHLSYGSNFGSVTYEPISLEVSRMSANNPIVQAMMLQQLGIDPTQQNNNTGALSNPGMGLGVLSMTGNRRGSPAFNSVPTRNEMLIRAGGAMVGAFTKACRQL